MARLNNSIRLKESNESLMTLKPQGEQNLDSASVYSGLHLRRETGLVLLDSRADLARNAHELSSRFVFGELQIAGKKKNHKRKIKGLKMDLSWKRSNLSSARVLLLCSSHSFHIYRHISPSCIKYHNYYNAIEGH